MKKQALRAAFRDTVPVLTGYVFLGFGFGILMYKITSVSFGRWP